MHLREVTQAHSEMSVDFRALLPPHWKEEVVRWVQQDMPKWDVGGLVVGEEPHHAMLLGKTEGVSSCYIICLLRFCAVT